MVIYWGGFAHSFINTKEYTETNKKDTMIIFTVIIGQYDNLTEVKHRNNECRYICITDNKDEDKSKGWEIVNVSELRPPIGLQGRKLQRWVKIIGAITYFKETSIYLDGSHEMINDISKAFINVNTSLCLKVHPARTDYVQEVDACIRLKKDNEDTLRAQAQKYLLQGYIGKGLGLFETGIIYREWNNSIRDLCIDWWDEVNEYSIRDQVSLPIILGRSEVEYKTITNDYFSRFIRILKHL